ncbi:unnamed protein product [Lathyrus oleraceus]|uniref:ATP-dependent 6-phosphofructokinase 2 n=1 Tax=Pisum sativum TaxID=3888 RepID=UPI0021CFE48E|nr:ATP-dependent 6-phosphofructokinase 2-like [Pisum sativum]
MRGAVKIFNEIRQRKLNIAVVGIPKTVDNDIGIIDRSFGFQTAVEMAQQAISAAHVEAESAVNGIGLVKLMGRSTGHIALHATLSSRDVEWWDREHSGELFTVKYIDPTYMIRAVHANATDNLYCTLLAHSAIHGVMGGYTGFVAGPINGNYAYIPLEDVACANNPVNTKDHNWSWVRSVTNQPDFLKS